MLDGNKWIDESNKVDTRGNKYLEIDQRKFLLLSSFLSFLSGRIDWIVEKKHGFGQLLASDAGEISYGIFSISLDLILKLNLVYTV